MTFITEGLSAIFEQLNKPLEGMVMGIVGLVICIVESWYRARVEQVTLKWKGSLPLLYSHYPTYKLFGSISQWFGLVVAMWQCFHSCFGYYYYARKNDENPIRMSITMILFFLCLVVPKIVGWYLRKTYNRL